MPPTSMFRKRMRLSGLEFASCRKCNEGTRAADAAAGFFARMSPTHETDQIELEEAHRLIGTLAQLAPQCIREVFDEHKSRMIWAKGRSNLLGRMHSIKLDGPVTHALMTAFAAKLGMAMFRNHIGRPMTKGGVYTQFYFNAGLTREVAKATLNILPLADQLKQGRQSSGRQFNYRYNTDLQTIVAAFAAFHDNMFVRVFAMEETEPYRFLLDEYNASFVGFGDLQKLTDLWRPAINA